MSHNSLSLHFSSSILILWTLIKRENTQELPLTYIYIYVLFLESSGSLIKKSFHRYSV